MRKTILFLLMVVLLTVLSASALAVEAKPGETVDVPLNLNNTNACYVKITATFDTDVFEFLGYSTANGQAGSSIVVADTKVLPSGVIG